MRYKISIKNISTMSKLPQAQQIFGFLFSTYLHDKKIRSNFEINCILDELNTGFFHISDCMPQGYIHNPNIAYILDDIAEPFTTKKSNLQKKYKKPDYISVDYLKKHLKKIDNVHYLKMDDNTEQIKENFISLETINSLKKNGSKSFFTQKLDIKIDSDLYFLLECDSKYVKIIDEQIKEKSKMLLGPKTSTGSNIFEVTKIEKFTISEKSIINGIVLSQYMPGTKREVDVVNTSGNIKVKAKSVRPIKMFQGYSENTRFLYNYIEPGNMIAVNTNTYGTLLSYRKCDSLDYNPRIFGKSYIFNLEEFYE